MRRAAAGLALALHIAVLLPALVSCEQRKPPPKKSKPQVLNTDLSVDYARTTANGLYRCERTYDGIGLAGMDNSPIWDVLPGGPAWKAGIREGDVLRGIDDFFPGQLPVGSILNVQKMKDGKWTLLFVKVEEICRK